MLSWLKRFTEHTKSPQELEQDTNQKKPVSVEQIKAKLKDYECTGEKADFNKPKIDLTKID